MTVDQRQFEARTTEARREGFRKWMQKPMTRALLSTLAPSEHLEAILQSCYDSGFNQGAGETALSFIEAVMKPRPR